MEKLVVDTMIWYHIGRNDPATIKAIKNYELIGTYISLREMQRTPLLHIDFQLVQNGMRSFLLCTNPAASYLNPFSYIAKLSGFEVPEIYSMDGQFWLEYIKIIAEAEKKSIPRDIITERFIRYEKMVDIEKDGIIEINNASKIDRAILLKNNQKNYDFRPSVRRYISKTVQSIYSMPVQIDWSQFELFEETFLCYYTDMVKTGRKLHKNDLHDLLQLVYVQPNIKFVTKETKWNKFIKNANLKDYLIEIGE